VLPVSDPTYVRIEVDEPQHSLGAVRLTREHGRRGQLGTVDLANSSSPGRLDGGSQLLL